MVNRNYTTIFKDTLKRFLKKLHNEVYIKEPYNEKKCVLTKTTEITQLNTITFKQIHLQQQQSKKKPQTLLVIYFLQGYYLFIFKLIQSK